jgi:CRP-like cAMP-binding protein
VNSDLIRFAPVFLGLTDQEREVIVAGFANGRAPANQNLLTAGEQSEALYLLEKGFVRLTTASGQNLATLGPGSVLGEASLFRATTQDVSAVAVSDLEYWKLSDRKLREIVLHHPMIGLKLSHNFGSLIAQMEDYLVQRLGRTQELSSLPHHTLQAVAGHLEPRTIRAGEALYRAGEPPAGLYVVESGAFELRPEGAGPDQEIQQAQPGAVLGALALLTNKPYVNTAVAKTDSLIWVLSTESFQAVNSRHPGLRRSFGRHVRGRLSKTDQAQAARRLAQMPIFAEVPPNSLQALAQRMTLQHVPAGERVYRVGESGDALYLIESGEVELTEENASGVVEEKARVPAGGFFGEMSLLTGLIRTEDATATRNTNLWVLAKSDVDELTTQHPALGKALSQGVASRLADGGGEINEERFRKFALLADLNPTDLRQVAERLRPTRYRAGESIYRINSPAETLFLIERGTVRVQPLSGPGWSISDGEAFGERALLTNPPHNTTVSAETDVDVWTLSKQDFEFLLNRYPSLAINMSRILSQRMMQTATDMVAYEPVQTQPASPAVARRRQAAAAQPQGAPVERSGGFGQWYANLTGWGKLRFALILLLILFLLGITVPAVLLALLYGPTRASTSMSRAMAAVYSMGSYELAAADSDTARTIAMVDSQVPPTPTYTPPPTNTPLVTPTSTPGPTNTPAPTTVSQFIPAAQESFAAAAMAAPPAEQPPPTPEEVQAAAALPRAWDSRLDRLGVVIEEAQVEPGQSYFRLIEGRWADEAESAGKHHIYIEVLDENGNRLVGQPVTVFWGEGFTSGPIEDKAPPDFGFNFQMYAAGYAYSAKVEGAPSDLVKGAGMGSLEQRMHGIHTSFYFVFQRTTK